MSDIQHIGGRTPDLTEENVDKLVALFPDVLTEVTDQQTGKAESGDYDDDGGQLVVNPESNGRFHSDWCSLLPGAKELRIELGCGKGRFTCQTAAAAPEVLFVAVERVPDAMVMAMERARDMELHNVFFIDADAANLPAFFAPDEVDLIYINFCDPWPPKRHAKRRLTHRDFLLRCAQKILNDPDRAEEALHEAMLRVIRSLERVRQIPAEELLPYLVTIVQTASIDLYHKTNRERQAAQGRERDWAESLSGTEDTELLLIRREQAELLRECLKTLPQREIDLLNYAYTLELSSKEITRLTGLAPGNVRQILTRARRKVLAAYIEKGGMNHE